MIERRSLASLGFHKNNAGKHYIIGCLVGMALMSLSVGLSALFGGLSISLNSNISWGVLALFFFGFIFQGASEEVIFRGYFMNTVASKGRIVTAIVLNSVFFGLAHSFNFGLTPLAFINLILFGVFASIYAIKFDDIWGVQVSGMDTGTSIFMATSTSNSNLLNGGSFGLEGSIFVTISLVVASIIVLFFQKPSKIYSKGNI